MHAQEIKFVPNVMCERVDKKSTFRESQVYIMSVYHYIGFPLLSSMFLVLYISYSDFMHLHCFKFIIINKYSHLWLWLLYFCNLSSLRMVILFASKSPSKLEVESDIAIQMFLLSWNMCTTVWYELFKLLIISCWVLNSM